METVLFENVKGLFDHELYSSVIPLASFLRSALQRSTTTPELEYQTYSCATPELEYQTLLYFGYSLYNERQFRAACQELNAALLMRKSKVCNLNPADLASIETAYPYFAEEEISYRIAVCQKEIGEINLAIQTLQAMPTGFRTPKINFLLARLIHHAPTTNIKDSIPVYKEVLYECPMALPVIESLLELGEDSNELNSMVMNASTTPKSIEWLTNWIKAHALMFARAHMEAYKTFQLINRTTRLHQNEILLTMIGRCLYYYGSFPQAQSYLETAVMINPNNMDAVMPLTVVYEYNQKLQDLERLAGKYNNLNEFTSAHWFVLAQNFYANHRLEKAASFSHKAISMDSRNIEAQLLRGKICLQMKRPKDAIYFFRAAQCGAAYRFEVYKGIFHCYVGLRRLKEAQTMCAFTVRYFRNSPRSFVMFARALFHSTNPSVKKDARKFAIKALEIDEHYAPAVALMAEIYQFGGETQNAIALLNKQVVNYPHHKLFTMLGDIFSGEKDYSAALEYYTMALNIDPSYERALSGVNALGRIQREGNKQEPDNTLATPNVQDEEWPINFCEPSLEAETSSPAVVNDETEADAMSEHIWQEVQAEATN